MRSGGRACWSRQVPSLGTVVVAAITTTLRLAEAPGNVKLTRRQSGLPKDSVVNVSQVLTMIRAFLTERVGRLPTNKMREVDRGLACVLDLTERGGT